MALSTCPVCGSTHTETMFEISQVPVHCNVLWPSREQAQSAPKADIRLAFCVDCGHIYNKSFDPMLMQYSEVYENSLHFSPRFRSYATSLAERLIADYDLHGKEVIEIGSGKGEFLRLLCDIGENKGIGFDPSYVPDPTSNGSGSITFIQDFYSERHASYKAHLICCRHVLEHVPDPAKFLAMVHHAADDQYRTVVFFEVPNALYMLRNLGIWDVIYEHYSYFSPASLERAFSLSGFEVQGLREEFGGQFLTIEASRHSSKSDGRDQLARDSSEITALASGFARKVQDKIGKWEQSLQRMTDAGQTAVIWGAGSKGVSFLNMVENGDHLEYVVDINPRKQGNYVSGKGARIVSPEQLKTLRPDVVIVMNEIYKNEINELTQNLGLSPTIVCM